MMNPYKVQIERLISPIVGDFIAKITLNFQCRALNIEAENVGPEHLEELSHKIGHALEVQGKQKEAEEIAEKIRNLR